MILFDQERPEDSLAIEALLDAAFGSNRFEKASYTLRENNPPMARHCLVAREGDRLVGTIRNYRIQVCDLLRGDAKNAVFLGPIAIAASHKDQGLGARLMSRALAALSANGHHCVLLVGDEGYYTKFEFQPVLPSYITLPGGRDARRLLVRQSALLPALPAVGKILPGWENYGSTAPIEGSLMSAA